MKQYVRTKLLVVWAEDRGKRKAQFALIFLFFFGLKVKIELINFICLPSYFLPPSGWL